MQNTSKKHYFTKGEITLWLGSVLTIALSYLIFDSGNITALIASLTGVTSLIFYAKGNPIGPVLMIFFCIIYGIISLSFRYYGEMMTYVFMSLPMAVVSFVSWIKNPYNGNKSEVTVYKISPKDILIMCIAAILTTAVFYFILKYLNTANLVPSTISVTTSFIAAFLSFKRSPYYALGYAANDVVLIILWTMATVENITYLSVIICFIAFLVNDIYGFLNWRKMEKRQRA